MRCLLSFLLAIAFCSGCHTVPLRTNYDPVGYKPKNPGNVAIKVSLQNRMVYVMEGSRPLLVTATAIGLPNKPTPRGRFHVTSKIADKRSGSYGFWVKGDTIVAGKSSQAPGGGYRYIGFPMQVLGGMDASLRLPCWFRLAHPADTWLPAPPSKRRA